MNRKILIGKKLRKTRRINRSDKNEEPNPRINRLHGVLLRAPFALPFLLAVLPGEVFFDSGEIAESSRRIVLVSLKAFDADLAYESIGGE
ncbi:hypothetical protein L1987_39067 [Smallanthus sonchifolius]|uniref:Uncharacterized protein n=1 Tax=Smallanthus sonchifolius TaxID=185202 RepID=A0ACB9HLA2_9ASTR|nr:hypothetical protein L1987_39067 [Smallanthus sonchifolius]